MTINTLIEASGQYLTECFPKEILKDKDKQLEFIENHKTFYWEDWWNENILEEIKNTESLLDRIIEQVKEEE